MPLALNSIGLKESGHQIAQENLPSAWRKTIIKGLLPRPPSGLQPKIPTKNYFRRVLSYAISRAESKISTEVAHVKRDLDTTFKVSGILGFNVPLDTV